MGPCSVWIGRFRNQEECGESEWATEKYFFHWRLFFKGMGYYSWPVKPLQIAMTSWLGLVLQGTNKGGFVPREPQRALRVSGDSEGGRMRRLEVTSGLFTWPNQTLRGNRVCQTASEKKSQCEAALKRESKRVLEGNKLAGRFSYGIAVKTYC